MPAPTLNHSLSVRICRRANDIPVRDRDAVFEDERNGNIIVPFLQKVLVQEDAGHVPKGNLWIIVSSAAHSFADPALDFIVAVTEGPMGAYPAFIYHARPLTALTPDFVLPRMRAVAESLYVHVGEQRIFSVFAVEPVARAFALSWTALTGIHAAQGDGKAPEEYYAALLSFCTRRSFRKRALTIDPTFTFDIRLALPEDIPAVAELCFGFAATSEPFTLTTEQARKEAELLVTKGMVWVHAILHPDGTRDIASICAVTRSSDNVAGITKVFTNPTYRGRKCAERLVRYVCQQLLRTKESVVLYVAHDNQAARNVYRRVGFMGLEGEVVPGVERWLEIGFDRDIVQLGHW